MVELLLAALITISGTVVDNTGAPLPGVTVTLDEGVAARTTVSNTNGEYAFHEVAAGRHTARYQVSGLGEAEQILSVHEGASTFPAPELVMDVEMVTLSCGGPMCQDSPPSTRYDMPLCSDYELNSALLETAASGDRSALVLLQSRYSETLSYFERHRIGVALLGKVEHDSAILRELLEEAQLCVRFPHNDYELSPEFLEWCATAGVPADEHWNLSSNALSAISNERRALPLLHKAIGSTDLTVATIALLGLCDQRDQASLPVIERAIKRFPDDTYLVHALALFRSEAADAIAMKYLQEDQMEEYREIRNQPAEPLDP